LCFDHTSGPATLVQTRNEGAAGAANTKLPAILDEMKGAASSAWPPDASSAPALLTGLVADIGNCVFFSNGGKPRINMLLHAVLDRGSWSIRPDRHFHSADER
jgi:hypothetical protein